MAPPSGQTLTPKHGFHISRAATRVTDSSWTDHENPRWARAWRWGGRTCHRRGRGSAARRGGDPHRPHPPSWPHLRCPTGLEGPPPPRRLAHANGQTASDTSAKRAHEGQGGEKALGPAGPPPAPPRPSPLGPSAPTGAQGEKGALTGPTAARPARGGVGVPTGSAWR